MPPIIGHDGPKTVTFGADTRTEAQHRSARLGSRVVGATLGVAAVVLAAVALIFNFSMAADIASTWRELIVLGSIAFALTLALAGLPVAAAVMRRSYPGEALRAMAYWATVLVITATGGLFFVFSTSRGHVLTAAEAARVEELRQAIRTLSHSEMAAWRRSADCTTPQSSGDQAACEAIHARDSDYRAEIAAIEAGPMPDAIRRLLVLAMALAAIAGAGLLGRLGVLASAESYRLAEGEAAAAPATTGLPAIAGVSPDGSGALTPLQVFDMWFAGRIRSESAGKLSASAAFADYEGACSLNGLPPVSAKKFGDLLTARAEASGGRIGKVKSAGAIFYTGIAFAGEPMPLAVVDGGELTALPYRPR